jgi:hypothetical protein
MYIKGHVLPFWKDEYKKLNYICQPFNDKKTVDNWNSLGYLEKNFTGEMYIADETNDHWTIPFFKLFSNKNVGVTFYKMKTSTVMPMHKDTFSFYKEKFKINDITKIKRALIFLENWESGHVFEIEQEPITKWKSGDFIIWNHKCNHLAANIGIKNRYTVQVTFTDV